MPNSDPSEEAKCQQLTGSSKRKRKQSIKRNIISKDELNSKESSKVEKTPGKKLKTSKSKSGKDCKEENMKLTEANAEPSHKLTSQLKNIPDESIYVSNEKAVSAVKGEEVLEEEETEKGGDDDNESLEPSKCSSDNMQCQNCKFCSKHKHSKQNLDDSIGKRLKKKFPCEICAEEGSSKVYNTIEKHKHHMATVHGVYGKEVKRFECTECPQKVWFPTKSKFVYHLGTKHPGIIKFICEICTETFKLKANYKNHLKTHNIVVHKKFSCDVCNGTFVNKAGYEAHKRRFPGPHIKQNCSHCGFSFSREKHLINHRCKTLLLEEAAARANAMGETSHLNAEDSLKTISSESKMAEGGEVDNSLAESDFLQKKLTETESSQSNKRVVLHRIVPRRGQESTTVYRPVQVSNQNAQESVVVQELREIDFENGPFATASSGANEQQDQQQQQQQFIVRDVNGHFVQGNQILQLDLNDIQAGEESQVYLADWNIVTPYVIREKSP